MSLIAVVEDEQDILEVLAYNLKREGFQVITADRGDEGLKIIEEQTPDLVLLDIMLPGMDGLEICKRIRQNKQLASTPIIMLTAKTEESDTVLGLGLGADDYVAKPFSPKELVARVKAHLRRQSMQDTHQERQQRIEVESLTIDNDSHRVFKDGEQIKLTVSEFRLLYALAKSAGRVLTREQLLSHILTDHAVVIDRNVDVHIRAVRKKLGDSAHLIETVRGVGYRFKEATA